jgi:uncharacterized membrane-anchored protein
MKRWFYLIVGLQIAFLLAEVTNYELSIRRGQLVTLRVVPVDPRSLFMGNYMALSYDISTIDLRAVSHDAPPEAFDYGRKVYVSLMLQQPWAKVHAVTIKRPRSLKRRPYLRGRIVGWDVWQPAPGMPAPPGPPAGPSRTVRIEYGLERYFIPEARQEEVNKLWWPGGGKQPPRITAVVSISGDGRAMIRRVEVDGKPLGF